MEPHKSNENLLSVFLFNLLEFFYILGYLFDTLPCQVRPDVNAGPSGRRGYPGKPLCASTGPPLHP